MAKGETKSKLDFIKQINQKWKKEQQCYDDAKVEGKDSRTGKKTTISWPRDKPLEQSMWGSWLQIVNKGWTNTQYQMPRPRICSILQTTLYNFLRIA